jgi:hypothetical protein
MTEQQRYEVNGPHDRASFVVVNALNANEPIFFTVIEAEAKIVAWALNAVAEGYVIFADDVRLKRSSRIYDGPTEGVAPR